MSNFCKNDLALGLFGVLSLVERFYHKQQHRPDPIKTIIDIMHLLMGYPS